MEEVGEGRRRRHLVEALIAVVSVAAAFSSSRSPLEARPGYRYLGLRFSVWILSHFASYILGFWYAVGYCAHNSIVPIPPHGLNWIYFLVKQDFVCLVAIFLMSIYMGVLYSRPIGGMKNTEKC